MNADSPENYKSLICDTFARVAIIFFFYIFLVFLSRLYKQSRLNFFVTPESFVFLQLKSFFSIEISLYRKLPSKVSEAPHLNFKEIEKNKTDLSLK